ncbi:MAG: quinolinate synthase NadA [Epsilonproteobacteria bacterium]|nr:quinolinate synthase NadA [Campylobacterota bacterium]
MNYNEMKSEINRLKREKNAIIIAHYYMRPEVQDVADYIGDSLGLARTAAKTDKQMIVFCGVDFMAETAKILMPDRDVLIPYSRAGCFLADMIIPEELNEYKEEYPGVPVVSYINTTAEIKALSDIICTSSNAVNIVKSLHTKEVIFGPDKNLAQFVADRLPEIKFHIWEGYCQVHERITVQSILEIKKRHPDAAVVVHPECTPQVIRIADFAGSTTRIINYVKDSDKKLFVIGTEIGIAHQIRKKAPGKRIIFPKATPLCYNMKTITLPRVLSALKKDQFKVSVDKKTAEKAKIVIEKMLAVS